jgi:hypothetical protein
MKVSQAVTFWLNYHRANSSKNTIRAYEELLVRFCQENGDKDLKELTSDDVLGLSIISLPVAGLRILIIVHTRVLHGSKHNGHHDTSAEIDQQERKIQYY